MNMPTSTDGFAWLDGQLNVTFRDSKVRVVPLGTAAVGGTLRVRRRPTSAATVVPGWMPAPSTSIPTATLARLPPALSVTPVEAPVATVRAVAESDAMMGALSVREVAPAVYAATDVPAATPAPATVWPGTMSALGAASASVVEWNVNSESAGMAVTVGGTIVTMVPVLS